MKLYKFVIAILFVLCKSLIFAKSNGPGSDIQLSPLLTGAGQIGVSIPNKEVFGYSLNPAILGYTANENHISYAIIPQEVNWFGIRSRSYSNYGFNIGYNIGKSNKAAR